MPLLQIIIIKKKFFHSLFPDSPNDKPQKKKLLKEKHRGLDVDLL